MLVSQMLYKKRVNFAICFFSKSHSTAALWSLKDSTWDILKSWLSQVKVIKRKKSDLQRSTICFKTLYVNKAAPLFEITSPQINKVNHWQRSPIWGISSMKQCWRTVECGRNWKCIFHLWHIVPSWNRKLHSDFYPWEAGLIPSAILQDIDMSLQWFCLHYAA